tara:strand:+ start:514 stop:1215 length:702 start_codon:yes stop_codon:yes gene_type:complete
MDHLLAVSKLNKSFKIGNQKLHVLKDVELSLNPGELVALMGPSGSGKSTLLNVVGGLLEADDGSVVLGEYEYGTKKPATLNNLRRNSIGWVFQNFNLLEHLSILDNVTFALTLSGFSNQESRSRATSSLDRVGLSDRLDFYPQNLSGGQNQRVSIARAISGDRPLLLADEPTGNLDSENGKLIIQLFQELCHGTSNPISVLMVTHDPVLASNADRILLLKNGKVVPSDIPVGN